MDVLTREADRLVTDDDGGESEAADDVWRIVSAATRESQLVVVEISVFPSSSATYPEGVVLAVNMGTAVNDPEGIADDLLIIDGILTANSAS